ncbi:MAG TPA: hypothetical protein VFU86_15425 [Terriglobales bacterium]|nr:hypothetical protein [Terriglobales bacterium]
MHCDICSDLQRNVEAAAREMARAVHDAQVAIQPISGIAAGNRIEEAERALRAATDILNTHKRQCGNANST